MAAPKVLCCLLVLSAAALMMCSATARKPLVISSDINTPSVSVPYNPSNLNNAADLPENDPRIARTIAPTDPTPEQVHLTHWGVEEMLVSWVTLAGVLGAPNSIPKVLTTNLVQPVVKYGLSSGNYPWTVYGQTVDYYQQYLPYAANNNTYKLSADDAANYFRDWASGLIHHALLTDLEPGQTYFYKVGDPVLGAWSQEFSFRQLPKPQKQRLPIRIGVFADLGQTYNSSSTLDHMIDSDPDIVLLIGDFCYADQYQPNGTANLALPPGITRPFNGPATTYQYRWDTFGRLLQPLAARKAIMHLNGNHEIEQQYDQTSHASYNARYPVPFNGFVNTQPNNRTNTSYNTPTNNMYFSFVVPGAKIIHLTSYIPGDDFGPLSKQYLWFEQELIKTDRIKYPWLIVNWHAPWYNTYISHFKENECMRQAYEPLFKKYHVDFSFLGHVHAYERTKPVYNNTVDACGTVHMTMGDGGNQEKLYADFMDNVVNGIFSNPSITVPAFCSNSSKFSLPSYQPQKCLNFESTGSLCYSTTPSWVGYREPSYGHGILTLVDETHATWEWHRNQDGNRVVADSVTFVRQPDGCKFVDENPWYLSEHKWAGYKKMRKAQL